LTAALSRRFHSLDSETKSRTDYRTSTCDCCHIFLKDNYLLYNTDEPADTALGAALMHAWRKYNLSEF